MLSQEKVLCTPLGTKENRYKVFSSTVKVRGVLLCCNCCFSHYNPFLAFLIYPAHTYFANVELDIYFVTYLFSKVNLSELFLHKYSFHVTNFTERKYIAE